MRRMLFFGALASMLLVGMPGKESVAHAQLPPPKPPPHLAFAPNGKILAVAEGPTVRLLDANTGRDLAVLPHRNPVRMLAFYPDSNKLVTATENAILTFWEAPMGLRAHETCFSAFVSGLAVSPRGDRIAVGEYTSGVRLFDPSTYMHRRHIFAFSTRPETIAFSPDGSLLAGAWSDASLWLWNTATGETTIGLDVSTNYGEQVVFSPNGWCGAGRTASGAAAVWELITGEKLYDHPQHERAVKLVGFADSRTLLLVRQAADGGWDASWRDLLTGQESRAGRGKEHSAAFAFSATTRRLATAAVGSKVEFTKLDPAPTPRPSPPSTLENIWMDLAHRDSSRAFRATWELMSNSRVVPFVKARLGPYLLAQERIDALIVELDDRRFVVRDRAMRELLVADKTALQRLRDALKVSQSLETQKRLQLIVTRLENQRLTPEQLRLRRVALVLDHIGSEEARALRRYLAP